MTGQDVRRLARLTLRVYGFAIVMALFAIVPGCNLFLYSPHGGPAWLILPFVFPVALLQLFLSYRAAMPEQRSNFVRFAVISLLAYLPLSFGACAAGATFIESWSGLPLKPLFLWGFFIFPFGLVFNHQFFGF